MKLLKKILIGASIVGGVLSLGLSQSAIGVAVQQGFQGGTGISTTTSGNNTLCLTQTGVGLNNSPLYAFSACGGGASGSSTILIAGGGQTSNVNVTLATSTSSGVYNIVCSTSSCTFTIPSNVGFFTNDSGYLKTSAATTTFTAQGATITGPAFTIATSGPLMAVTVSGQTITFTSVATSTILSGYATSTGSNPSANVGLNVVNGSANTFLRSDAASALSQSIAPTWTGLHIWNGGATFNSTGTFNSSTIFTALSTHTANLTLNAGALLQVNGVPVTDGGGNWIGSVVQGSGSNVIIQAATGTAVLGALVQGGSILSLNASTTLTGAQFCGTGVTYVQGTSANITITIPATSTVVGFPCNTGTNKIYSGTWSTQWVYNNSTNTVGFATTGDSEIQTYSPGTPTTLSPNQEMMITGTFESSTQQQFATSSGIFLVVKYTLFQTSTPFTVNGTNISLPNIAANSFLATNGAGILVATGTPSGGGGGSGTVTTSSPIFANGLTYFPSATGSALNSTSSIMIGADSSLSSTALRVASATIVTLLDATGNKYATSTSAAQGTLTTSTPWIANGLVYPATTNGTALNSTSSLTFTPGTSTSTLIMGVSSTATSAGRPGCIQMIDTVNSSTPSVMKWINGALFMIPSSTCN